MSIFINGIDISNSIVNNITTGTTLTRSHITVTCDASGGGFTVTLPASSNSKWHIYNIKKTDSTLNTVTIDGNASETIDGSITRGLTTQYQSITIICDGSNWHII